MNLKVFLLITLITLAIFYIIIITVSKVFDICVKTENFAVESMGQVLNRAVQENTIEKAKAAQNKAITEIGGKIDVDDPVSDANMPYSYNVYDKPLPSATDMQNHKNYEYMIINTYKKVLNRNPTQEELTQNVRLFRTGENDENKLRIVLYNSTEYAMSAKVQSNEIGNELEYAYAKEDMLTLIAKMYYDELNVEVPKNMLMPLRDVFMYFENDQYLFRAFLISDHYVLFENEVKGAKRLKKEDLITVFNKHFVLTDLKYKANDIRRYDMLTKQNVASTVPENLPVNTNFQGADLQILSQGVGAGSGAQFDQSSAQNTISLNDLAKQITENNVKSN